MEMNYQNSLMEFKINVRFLYSWKSPITKKHIPRSTIRTNLNLDISEYSGINKGELLGVIMGCYCLNV